MFYCILFYIIKKTIVNSCILFLEAALQRCSSVFCRGVLKTCSKFTGDDPYQSVISTKLLYNFIKITLRYECSPVNLPYIFRAPFPKDTSGGLLFKKCESCPDFVILS